MFNREGDQQKCVKLFQLIGKEHLLLMLFFTTSNLCSLTQIVMDQFNPGLRNLVNLGKSYEKSVTGRHSFHPHIRDDTK